MAGENFPLIGSRTRRNIQQSNHDVLESCLRGCCCISIQDLLKSLHVLLISLLTDWPWKIAAFYASDKDIPKPNCLTTYIQLIYVILRFLLVIVAMVTKDIISFRRDCLDNTSSSGASFPLPPVNLYRDYDPSENANESATETVSANIIGPAAYKPLKLFGENIILDLITIILLIWVLRNYFRSLCKRNKPTENPVGAAEAGNVEKRNNYSLEELIDKVNKMQIENRSSRMICTKILAIIIPIGYVICSAGVSAMYLSVYFKHTEVIWPEEWEITGCLKVVVIITLLVSTTAVDLLFIQIVIKYILHCQLNIYFLQLITKKVEVKSNEAYKNQDEAEQDLIQARGFLKKLNKSSKIVELAIIYALIQAINTAINLSNDTKDSNESAKPQFRELALICRLIGGIFLIMAPFFQASKANKISETLCDSDLAMYKYPIMFRENTPPQKNLIEKNVSKIVLNAKLFNLTIHPGFIRLAIIGILLFFAVKSGFQLFEKAL